MDKRIALVTGVSRGNVRLIPLVLTGRSVWLSAILWGLALACWSCSPT